MQSGNRAVPKGFFRLQDCVQSGNWIAGLLAIGQLDCRTACNQAIGLYQGVFWIAGLRAISQLDCRTGCNQTVRLQDWVQSDS